ncbi:hypothetical protein D3C86_1104570 [compost metagenome]
MERVDRVGLNILKFDFLDIRPCATEGDIAQKPRHAFLALNLDDGKKRVLHLQARGGSVRCNLRTGLSNRERLLVLQPGAVAEIGRLRLHAEITPQIWYLGYLDVTADEGLTFKIGR